MNIQQFAMNLIQNSPQFKNNPRAQNLIDIIRSNDQQRGIEAAENLCKTYGTSKEDALSMARSFFKI